MNSKPAQNKWHTWSSFSNLFLVKPHKTRQDYATLTSFVSSTKIQEQRRLNANEQDCRRIDCAQRKQQKRYKYPCQVNASVCI